MDVPEWFCRALVVLAEAYPAMRLREGTYRAYWAVLADLPQTAVEAAVIAAPREFPTFFPAAGDLRTLVTGRPDDTALLAWTGLQAAASAVGGHASLVCQDPAAAQALKTVFGGWPTFCEQCVDDGSHGWTSKRAEFLAAYRTARRHLVSDEPVQLPGLCETDATQAVGWVGLLHADGTVGHSQQRQLGTAPDVAQLPEATFDDER